MIRQHRTQIGILATAIVVTAFGCNKDPGLTANKSNESGSASVSDLPRVATMKATRQQLLQKTEQPGRIEAFSTTHIHAKVSGFMEQLLADIGDRVTGPKKDEKGNIIEAGQLLAVLVAPELIDELQQKQAMIVQAKADIDQATAAIQVAESMAISADAHLDEFIAGQQRAESEYQRWKSEADRINALAASKTVTQKLAEEASQQLKSAEATRSEAAAKIRSAKAKQNEATIAIAKAKADGRSVDAKLSIAEAEFQRVQSLCTYLQIRAPYDGIISVRNFDPGALIQASRSPDDKPLFTIIQSDKVRVFMEAPESDAVMVEPGRKAVVKVPALGSRTFEGTVSRTSWALQAATRTLRCEIEVSNNQGVLRPGMYANVELIVAQVSNALALPKAAIIQHEGQAACLIVSSEGLVTRKAIQTGIRSSTDVEIISGLDGSEDVIVANASAFKDGQKVAKASK